MTFIPEIETMADVPRYHARVRPKSIAMIDGERVSDYARFQERTAKVANALLGLGVKPGSRIAAIDQNSDRYFEILFGAAKVGAVLVSVNWRLAPPEIAYILNDARAEVVFIGQGFGGLIKPLLPELPHLKHIIVVDGTAENWPSYESWIADQSTEDPPFRGSAKDTIVQMYTSGTTGNPKGVQLSHFSLYAHDRNRALMEERDPQLTWNEWDANDVSLVAMPGFHISGTGWGIVGPLQRRQVDHHDGVRSGRGAGPDPQRARVEAGAGAGDDPDAAAPSQLHQDRLFLDQVPALRRVADTA